MLRTIVSNKYIEWQTCAFHLARQVLPKYRYICFAVFGKRLLVKSVLHINTDSGNARLVSGNPKEEQGLTPTTTTPETWKQRALSYNTLCRPANYV